MRLKIWIRALRAPFFQAVIVPLLLGTAVAWYQTDRFDWRYFLAALFGVVFVHAGTNLINDYFDHRTGADELNRQHTRFSGGSRIIQEGLLSPRSILVASLIFFGLGSALGVFLGVARGWPVLAIGAAGVVSGYFYTAAPLRLGYRGWGELITGLNCGPLVVLGAYYVQAQTLSWSALVAALPVGVLIAAILYVNQFSDYDADKAAGKRHLVVRLGPERAARGFYWLLAAAYVPIAAGCAFGLIPWLGLAALVTVPLAWRAASIAASHCSTRTGEEMAPAMSGTIATHLVTGLLLSGSYLAAGLMR
jgi:1,4-dihydroxy-2-naphthoate octaprenyltransferase